MKKLNIAGYIVAALAIIGVTAFSIIYTIKNEKTPDEKYEYMEAYMDGYKDRILENIVDSTLYFEGVRAGVNRAIYLIENSESDTIIISARENGQPLRIVRLKPETLGE